MQVAYLPLTTRTTKGGEVERFYIPVWDGCQQAPGLTVGRLSGETGPGDHPCDHHKVSGAAVFPRDRVHRPLPPNVIWDGKLKYNLTYSPGGVTARLDKAESTLGYMYVESYTITFTKFVRTSGWAGMESHLSAIIWHNGSQESIEEDNPISTTYGFGLDMYSSDLHEADIYPITLDEAIALSTDPGIPKGAVSELFRTTANSIVTSSNNIANIVDMVGLVRDLKNMKFSKVAADVKKSSLIQKASKAWMSYRYSYLTTKSDIDEAREKIAQAIDPNRIYDFKRYGTLWLPGGLLRLALTVSTGSTGALQQLDRMLHACGLQLSLYNAWDMVPLSFVVDWFLPIGDFLEDLSSNWVTRSDVFTFSKICYSYKHVEQITFPDSRTYGCYTHYTRWLMSKPPAFESYSEDPQTGTVIKRCIDGLAMIVG